MSTKEDNSTKGDTESQDDRIKNNLENEQESKSINKINGKNHDNSSHGWSEDEDVMMFENISQFILEQHDDKSDDFEIAHYKDIKLIKEYNIYEGQEEY